jgi:hypothetical protein
LETPKALANFSPGLERSDNPGIHIKVTTLGYILRKALNPERVSRGTNPFRVPIEWGEIFPGLSLRSNPGLKLANAFGIIKLNFNLCTPLFECG